MQLGRDSFTKGIDYETNSSFPLSIVGGFIDYTLSAWNHDGKD
jgi:hypothetical protein